MKKIFIVLLGLVFGNYRDLLKLVQRIRHNPDVYEIQHREYHELAIPNPVLRKLMDKRYAAYMNSHSFNMKSFQEFMIKNSLGCLMAVKYSSKSPQYKPIEFEALFNGSEELISEYLKCFGVQNNGVSTYDCIDKLIDDKLEGVHLEHAKLAIDYLDKSKRISQSHGIPTFSTIQIEEQYLEELYIFAYNIFQGIADDRMTLIPEVVYVMSLFRYIYHMSSFMGKAELSSVVFNAMNVVINAANHIFTKSIFPETYLRTPHRVTFKNDVFLVDRIVPVGVSQRQRNKIEFMRVFFTDRSMCVSFPHHYQTLVSSLIADAKIYLLYSESLVANPMVIQIRHKLDS